MTTATTSSPPPNAAAPTPSNAPAKPCRNSAKPASGALSPRSPPSPASPAHGSTPRPNCATIFANSPTILGKHACRQPHRSAQLRRLAAATTHARARTHPRTRRPKPSTTRPDRPPARPPPRQPPWQQPRRRHLPRHKHPEPLVATASQCLPTREGEHAKVTICAPGVFLIGAGVVDELLECAVSLGALQLGCDDRNLRATDCHGAFRIRQQVR